MTIERKVGMGIAGQPSGATDVAEVFSTTLYTGNSTARSINNGIDLDGEGGLVWVKDRDAAKWHKLADTERGANKLLFSNEADMESTVANTITGFNNNGFSLGVGGTGNNNDVNTTGTKYASWTFRKKKKFFDIVTYSGNSVNGRSISHSLDSPVGMMIVKVTNANGQGFQVFHKDCSYPLRTGYYNTYTAGQTVYSLNDTGAPNSGQTHWNNTSPTSTHFTVGTSAATNQTGGTYVAYLFADNSAEDAEDQMIKCGYYHGNANANGPIVNLGWEPQFLLIRPSSTNNWLIYDNMRGVPRSNSGIYNSGKSMELWPNLSSAENWDGNNPNKIDFTATGFQIKSASATHNKTADDKGHLFMAIRAPMMVEPTAAIDVFNIDTAGANGDGAAPNYRSTFPVDFALHVRSGGPQAYSRLTGPTFLYTDSTNDEGETSQSTWDFMNGWYNQNSSQSTSTTQVVNMWKKAKGFFDVVCYDGTGSVRTVPHSLSVIPEMIWIKSRSTVKGWQVYTAEGAGSSYLTMNENYNYSTNNTRFNNTAATSSVFTVGTAVTVNNSTTHYIAYLFATLAGISKCGSYTGNGSSQTIDCGFSAGARFVLIKRANLAVSGNEGDWYLWDTTRGIVAGNDPYKLLNTNAAEVTSDDSVDPANSGFIVNQVSATNINVSSSTYIFYAIA